MVKFSDHPLSKSRNPARRRLLTEPDVGAVCLDISGHADARINIHWGQPSNAIGSIFSILTAEVFEACLYEIVTVCIER